MMRSLALAALAASAVALAPPGAPRTLKTRRQAVVSEPDAKAKVSSANAKRQVGNDAFLNKDLRARARGGTGVVNDAKLKIGIVGAGLAGMVCAMDLADAGHEVEIFELRPFVGGKVSSWKDKEGNHIEMGLHVFFGCYYNLFGIMERTGSYDLLRMKEHIHTFVNKGGELGALDFRFPVGAPVSGLQAFARTEQLGWGDKAANALRLGTSPIVRALVDFDGGMDMVRDLDDITFTEWFTSFGGSRGSIDRMWDPIAYALGFIDCDHISARCMLTIFMLFAIRTEASVLRMLDGSPQTYLHDPIVKYLEERGVKINLRTGIRDIVYETDSTGKPCKVTGLQVQSELKEFDAVVAAVDLPGAKKLIPEPFRVYPEFDRIYELDAVPIATVQLRFDGAEAASFVHGRDGVVASARTPWRADAVAARRARDRGRRVASMASSRDHHVASTPSTRAREGLRVSRDSPFTDAGWVTELQDQEKMKSTEGDLSDGRAPGIDNLLYSADAEFSCFADLALTSPAEYYKEGEGSLMQCVMDSRAYGRSEAQIVQDTLDQIHMLFPSSKDLTMTWSNVVKLGQSLYREKPGQDKYRPSQATPIPNFFLAGSYTYQDYIDSMEGATKSGLMCADEIVSKADAIAAEAAKNLDLPQGKVPPNVPGRGPLDMTAAVTFVDDGSFDANENTDMSQRPASAPAIDSF